VWQISNELWKFLSSITEGKSLSDFIQGYILSQDAFGANFDIGEKIGEFIYDGLVKAVGSLAGFISNIAKAVPRAILALFVTLIASVYFALDLEKIVEAVKKAFPDGIVKTLRKFKLGFFTIGVKYIRSYSLLMLITFAIIFFGLLVLRVQYFFILAVIIAVPDILPIIGVGTVLIPWSIFSFVGGNGGLGIGLLVLYLANSIIRQALEARLIGKNLGVHPIVSLILIYLGYSLFGFVGIILVPIFTVIMNIYVNNSKNEANGNLEI
jgi:sporulation integral membrane protein YtvI